MSSATINDCKVTIYLTPSTVTSAKLSQLKQSPVLNHMLRWVEHEGHLNNIQSGSGWALALSTTGTSNEEMFDCKRMYFYRFREIFATTVSVLLESPLPQEIIFTFQCIFTLLKGESGQVLSRFKDEHHTHRNYVVVFDCYILITYVIRQFGDQNINRRLSNQIDESFTTDNTDWLAIVVRDPVPWYMLGAAAESPILRGEALIHVVGQLKLPTNMLLLNELDGQCAWFGALVRRVDILATQVLMIKKELERDLVVPGVEKETVDRILAIYRIYLDVAWLSYGPQSVHGAMKNGADFFAYLSREASSDDLELDNMWLDIRNRRHRAGFTTAADNIDLEMIIAALKARIVEKSITVCRNRSLLRPEQLRFLGITYFTSTEPLESLEYAFGRMTIGSSFTNEPTPQLTPRDVEVLISHVSASQFLKDQRRQFATAWLGPMVQPVTLN